MEKAKLQERYQLFIGGQWKDAFTASSTSSFVAWAHSANTLPSAGQIVLNVSWAEASFHRT